MSDLKRTVVRRAVALRNRFVEARMNQGGLDPIEHLDPEVDGAITDLLEAVDDLLEETR